MKAWMQIKIATTKQAADAVFRHGLVFIAPSPLSCTVMDRCTYSFSLRKRVWVFSSTTRARNVLRSGTPLGKREQSGLLPSDSGWNPWQRLFVLKVSEVLLWESIGMRGCGCGGFERIFPIHYPH